MGSGLTDIVEGWKNLFVKDPDIEPIAKERAEVCSKCRYASRKEVICTLCGCPLAAKTRTKKNTCPIGKWKR